MLNGDILKKLRANVLQQKLNEMEQTVKKKKEHRKMTRLAVKSQQRLNDFLDEMQQQSMIDGVSEQNNSQSKETLIGLFTFGHLK